MNATATTRAGARRRLRPFRMTAATAAKRRVQASLLVLLGLLAAVVATCVLATITLYRSA